MSILWNPDQYRQSGRWYGNESQAARDAEQQWEDTPDSREKLATGPRGISVPQFLPYYDALQSTFEGPEMRIAYRRMLADPDIKASLVPKVISVGATEISISPYGKKWRPGMPEELRKLRARNEYISEFVSWNLHDRVEGGIPGLVWEVFIHALIDGLSVCERVWDGEDEGKYRGREILACLKAKDVDQDLVIEHDEFKNITSIKGLRYNAGETYDPSEFVIYRYLPLYGNLGLSDLRAAYASYWMLDTVLKLRAWGAEKRAFPVIVGEYPDPSKQAATNAALARIKSQNWLAVPAGVKAQLLQVATGAEEYFKSFCADLRERMVTSIQSATLHQMAGRQGQERGDTQTHESRGQLWEWFLSTEFCTRILNDHKKGLIPDLVRRNFQAVDGYPKASAGGIDEGELNHSLTLDTGLKQLGFEHKVEDLEDRYGREMAGPNDQKLMPPGQQPGQGGPPGQPGAPGAPGGQPPGPGGAPQQPQPGGQQSLSSGQIQALGQRLAAKVKKLWVNYSGPHGGHGKKDPVTGHVRYESHAETWESFAGGAVWTRGTSKTGHTKWTNSSTGRVVYQENQPGDHEAGQPDAEGGQKGAPQQDPNARQQGQQEAPEQTHEKIVSFVTAGDKLAAEMEKKGVLRKLGAAGKALLGATAKLYKKIEARYGRKVGLAIFAAGQVTTWTASAIGAANGVPVWVPSAAAMAPYAALAEVYLQMRRSKGGESAGASPPDKSLNANGPNAAAQPQTQGQQQDSSLNAKPQSAQPTDGLPEPPAVPNYRFEDQHEAGDAFNSEPVQAVEKQFPPANTAGRDSFERHQKDGQWTKERQALHNAIRTKLRGHVPPSQDKTYFMMGGGPASGKSSVIHEGLVSLPKNHVMIDSDGIKGELPEYHPMIGAKDDRAAGYAHEESSHLAKVVQADSFAASQDVVLDGTGDNSLAAVEKKAKAARAAGYKVHAAYTTCSTEEAVRRNLERAKKTGRLPPEEMLRQVHRGVSDVLPAAIKKGVFDNVSLYDTEHKDGNGKPTLVMSAAGTNLTVHNHGLWAKFLSKGSAGKGEEEYVSQAMGNLKKTSRTAQGNVDTSASPGKAAQMAASGDVAAQHATKNFEGVVRGLHRIKDVPIKTPEHAEKLIDHVAGDINKGIVKEGVLNRVEDSAKYPYTRIADLPAAKKQFAAELHARLNDPSADPVETAAWIEWRSNLTDHFWADGCGKTAKALAAIPLMRAGLPLPNYTNDKTLFPRKIYDPKQGGAAYLDENWAKFRDQYKAQVQRPAATSSAAIGTPIKPQAKPAPAAAPIPPAPDINKKSWSPKDVGDLAKHVRAVVEKVSKGDTADYCLATSLAIAKAIPGAQVYEGNYGGGFTPHAIVKVGNHYLDLTADQFGDEKIKVMDKLEGKYADFAPSKRKDAEHDDEMHAALAKSLKPGGHESFAELFAEADWQPYTGKHGGKGWKNSVTGKVAYQTNRPGALHEGKSESDFERVKADGKVYRKVGREWVNEKTGKGISADAMQALRSKGKVTDVPWEEPAQATADLAKLAGMTLDEVKQLPGAKEFASSFDSVQAVAKQAQQALLEGNHEDIPRLAQALQDARNEALEAFRHTLLKAATDENLGATGGGSNRGGLPAGESVGVDAGEASQDAVPGAGSGDGQRVDGLHPDSGERVDGPDAQLDGQRDESALGQGNGDGAALAAAGRRDRQAGAVGDGDSRHGSGRAQGAAAQSLAEEPTQDNPTDVAAGGFTYTDRSFVAAGLKTKFNNNIAALKCLRAIQLEGRTSAAPDEQEIMSKYVGWGQFPGVFNEYRDPGYDREEAKKWDKERTLLRGILSDEEWKSAKGSTLNAHYTHPDVVDAHWKIAQRLGFNGGRFLETSAGIGYYLGMMPPDLRARTHSSAVELDKATGAMLQLLYPKSAGYDVNVQGFQDHLSPDGFYDFVASNVPFGAYDVADPRYDKHEAHIHDYFFLKSADKVRPGGLIQHITSTGTLDNPNSKIRKELAKNFDLVSAIRFPGGAHEENAGTSVSTDMVILRKRLPGEKAKDSSWTDIGTVPDPDGGEPIECNQYFIDHPEQMLGRLDRSGTMYGGEEKNVNMRDDREGREITQEHIDRYHQRLAEAIERLPKNVMTPNVAPADRFAPEALPAPGDVKDGGYVMKDGKLYRRNGGGMTEHQIDPKAAGLIEAHLSVRDAYRQLILDQTNGVDATKSRARLHEAYDAFVAKHGPLNATKNKKAFAGDPDDANLLALEKWDAKAGTATKEAMFERDTVRAVKPVTSVGTLHEGVAVSLHENGRLDIAHIGRLLGKDESHVKQHLVETGLAYDDPTHGFMPADQYLSGNVRRKLALAKAAAANDPRFRANVEALEKVQPEDVDHTKINLKIGSPVVPPSDIAEFAAHLLSGEAEHFNIGYNPASGAWEAKYSNLGKRQLSQTDGARTIWATPRANFETILGAALNARTITIKDPTGEHDEKGNAIYAVNEKDTEDANAKVQELKDNFKEWVWEDDARRERLHRYYNDNYNNIRDLHYNGQHLSFPGMDPAYKPHSHIPDFVWQVICTGNGLAAHEVGMGKTTAMVASAMELRRLGLAKKPAIACLKANIESITNEARKMYPGAKILSTAGKFDKKQRRETMSKIATGDYDMVIMTHDNLNMLKMTPEVQKGFIEKEIDELQEAKVAAYRNDPSGDNRIVKQLEKSKKDLEAKLQKIMNKEGKDDNVYFEHTGIDQLFVDEAHKYKSLPVYTSMDRVKGVPTTRSDRATNMLMRVNWLREKNGGRGVVFATGTPVANTMAELYNLQKYLQPELLKERGLQSFDSWAKMFGEVVTKLEYSTTGEYKQTSRFAEFNNIPELMQMVRQFMDVRKVDSTMNKDGQPVVKRPKRTDIPIIAPKTPEMVALMDKLKARAQALKGPAVKGGDNHLVICTDGRKGALDMRLLDDNAADNPNSKTNLCIGKVLELYKARPGTAQIIFSDLGVHPKKDKVKKPAEIDEDGDGGEEVIEDAGYEAIPEHTGKFHLYQDIIDKLVQGGVPREQIADFSQLEGKKKEAAQAAMRAGEIRVALGSTEKLGTGVNVQDKVTAMHHLDVPWVPAAVEQRNGRGHRFGNKNNPNIKLPNGEIDLENQKVEVYTHVAEGSLDQKFWDVINTKTGFINAVITQSGSTAANIRDFKDEDSEELTPAQLTAIASGDPRVMEKVELDDEVKKLKADKDRHARTIAKHKDIVKRAEQHTLPALTETKRKISADVATLNANHDFSMEIDGHTYTDRGEAHKAFEAKFKEMGEAAPEPGLWGTYEHKEAKRHEDKLGTYRGLEVWRVGPKGDGRLELRGEGRERDPYHGTVNDAYPLGSNTLASTEAIARQIAAKHLPDVQDRIARVHTDIAKAKQGLEKKYTGGDVLNAKLARQKELEEALGGSTSKAQRGFDEQQADDDARQRLQAKMPVKIAAPVDNVAPEKQLEAIGKGVPNVVGKMNGQPNEEGYIRSLDGYDVGPFFVTNLGGEWGVYHKQTGLRATAIKGLNNAKAVAAIMSQKGNWDFDDAAQAMKGETAAHGRAVNQAAMRGDYAKLIELAQTKSGDSLFAQPPDLAASEKFSERPEQSVVLKALAGQNAALLALAAGVESLAKQLSAPRKVIREKESGKITGSEAA